MGPDRRLRPGRLGGRRQSARLNPLSPTRGRRLRARSQGGLGNARRPNGGPSIISPLSDELIYESYFVSHQRHLWRLALLREPQPAGSAFRPQRASLDVARPASGSRLAKPEPRHRR